MSSRFRKYAPLAVEWLSLGGIVVAGDAFVQSIEHRTAVAENSRNSHKDGSNFKFDSNRSFAMSIAGLFWMGPLAMAWFPFVHRFMARHLGHVAEGSVKYVASKVMLENTFLAMPVCLGFFAIPAVVEGGEQLESLPLRMKQDFMPSFWTDIAFWTCFSPFNYKYVPLRYQPAISCVLGGVEAAGLSYITHVDGFQWPTFKFKM